MFSPEENMLFLLEAEERPQLPQLGAAGLAPQGGQETRLPLGGGDWLLFGFVIHQLKLERSPGWSCWGGRGAGLFWASVSFRSHNHSRSGSRASHCPQGWTNMV